MGKPVEVGRKSSVIQWEVPALNSSRRKNRIGLSAVSPSKLEAHGYQELHFHQRAVGQGLWVPQSYSGSWCK